jgi:hypothetical protein
MRKRAAAVAQAPAVVTETVRRGAPSSTWKSVERRVCQWYRGTRAPLSGRNGGAGTSGDYVGRPWLYIEIKHKAKAAIFSLFQDTARKAQAEQRTPLCVYHMKGTQQYIAVSEARWLARLIDAAESAGIDTKGI